MFAKDRKNIQSIHKTVLLNETIKGLNLLARLDDASPRQNDFVGLGSGGDGKNFIVLDGTFGGGGHSELLCKKYKGIRIIALDQDKNSFKKTNTKFKDLNCNISFFNTNFRDLDKVLEKEKIKGIDGIILDLGLSSDQLENSGRGFSFMKDEILKMTMKENPSPEDLTASDIVNNWTEENLATIIYGYGEERFSRRIAKGIVDARQQKKIENTFSLVEIIARSVPVAYRRGRIHFATKTFQALRIAVNDELEALKEALEKGFGALKINGRMVVISFHSLEDRIVKRFYKNKQKKGIAKLINKKLIKASAEEIKKNPRSRSAKLRILEKI